MKHLVRFSVLALLLCGLVGGASASSFTNAWTVLDETSLEGVNPSDGSTSSISDSNLKVAPSDGLEVTKDYIYAGDYDNGNLAVFDRDQQSHITDVSLVSSSTYLSGVEQVNGYVFATFEGDTNVYRVEIGNWANTQSADLSGAGYDALESMSNGNLVATPDYNTPGYVVVFDQSLNEQYSVQTDARTEGIGVCNNKIYTGQDDGSIVVYDFQLNQVDSGSVGGRINGLQCYEGNILLNHGDSGGNQHLTIMDGSVNQVDTVQVDGNAGQGDDISGAGDYIAASDKSSQEVLIYDVSGSLSFDNRVYTESYGNSVRGIAFTGLNSPPSFNSTSVSPDPPLIGENVSYGAEVYDSDGSVDYTNLSLSYGGSTVVSDEQRTGTTPEWNDVFTPQDSNKWLNATLSVVDDKGAVTTTEINRFLGDSNPGANINSPAGKVFDYDQSINVDTEDDGDSNPDEQLSCSLELDGNQIDQRTVTEGDSYTVNARANLGNHSAVVTCTEQDDGKQDTGSTTFTVQDFEIQSISSASQVFETEERSFSLSYRSGDMIQNQDAELSLNYDGETDNKSFSLQPSEDRSESIKRNIPLVDQNQTVKNFDLSVNYRYDNFTGQTETETVSGSDFSTNNTKEEGNFYNVEVVSTSDGNKYVLNGTRRKKIDLERGVNHTFNLTSSVQGHPFHISTSAIGGNFDGQITEGVSVTDPYNGNEHAADTGKLFYKPLETESRDLYYQCGVHQYMGADITLLEALTFSNSQTVNQAFSYDNSVFEDGLTQLEASTLDFEAKVNKQVTNNRADLSASSTLQQTGETRTLEQDGTNFTGLIDTDLINSTSTTTNLDTTVTVSFNGETRTFSNTDTLTLEKIQLSKSSSTGPKTLQFETRDEINNSLIDANVEAGITVNNPDQPGKTRFFGFDFSKDKTHELFLSPSDATVTANVFEERSIAYENLDAGFPGRRHYLTDTTLDNETTNINLYLLEQTKGSTVRLELTNSDLQGLSNHLIRVERAFPDQNETRTVQLAKTGTEGFASTFLQLQERYIFTVFDENGDLVDQVGPETVTTSDKRIQVNDNIDPSLANVLNEVQFTDIQRGNQSLSVSYVSETQRLNNLFLKISSDGLFETKTLDVDSSEQPQGQLEVNDFNASEQKVFFELIGTFGETNLTLESGTFGQESNDFGNAGIFVSFLMFTALTLSGLFRPSAAIGLGVISIFVMSFTGFLAVGQQALISIAALAAVLIWRMSSR